jgi:hypothetical protein
MTAHEMNEWPGGSFPPVQHDGPLDSEFARALDGTLNEWGSEADERAYAEL